MLAALQVTEALVALQGADSLGLTTALAVAGVVPHVMPKESSSVRSVLGGLAVVADAIDRRDVPGPGATTVTPEDFSDALRAIGAAMQASGPLTALSQAAAGWRTFARAGDTVRLMYRLPEYMIRAVELNVREEAEHNAAYVEASQNSPEDSAFHRRLEAIRTGSLKVDPRQDPQTLEAAVAYAHRAGELLHRWRLPPEIAVENRGEILFTVAEYRAAAEAVHGLATISEILADGIGTVGASRLLQALRSLGWVSSASGRRCPSRARATFYGS